MYKGRTVGEVNLNYTQKNENKLRISSDSLSLSLTRPLLLLWRVILAIRADDSYVLWVGRCDDDTRKYALPGGRIFTPAARGEVWRFPALSHPPGWTDGRLSLSSP